jgi:hypothetical protein
MCAGCGVTGTVGKGVGDVVWSAVCVGCHMG